MEIKAMTNRYRLLAEQLHLPYKPKTYENEVVHGEHDETIKEYIDIIDNMQLPGGITTAQKHICVVGAGVAGMISATLLANKGHKVTLIDANDRFGGRLKTFDGSNSGLQNGQYAEAGAMRFPSFHPLINTYTESKDIDVQTFYNVSVDMATEDPESEPKPVKLNKTVINCNRQAQRKADYGVDGAANVTNQGFYQNSNIKQTTAGALLDKALDPVRDMFSYVEDDQRYDLPKYEDWIEGWADVIRKFDKYSLVGFLRDVANLDESTIDLIGSVENLSSRMPLSFMHSFIGRSDINPNVVYHEYVGGSVKLSDTMKSDVLGNSLITVEPGRRLVGIDYAGDSVTLRTVSEEDRSVAREDEYDHAIITIPFSSLRFVKTEPKFSYGKRRAIMELHYDAATKVVLQFNERWWEWDKTTWEEKLGPDNWALYADEFDGTFEEGKTPALEVIGGGSVTDNPNRNMYYPSHAVGSDEGGVILASYTWADDARRWDSMDDKNRYEYALRGLIQVHGEKITPFVTGITDGVWQEVDIGAGVMKVKGAATQSWALNPYAFGEAAVFQAKQMTHLHPDIPTPECSDIAQTMQKVFFAGEHTSLKHAWVEGALESAIRTALEVVAVTDVPGE
jgi:monoamine oxidase